MFWACARLEAHRERLALHCLGLNGYTTYLPRLRERRASHGRKIEIRAPLFPGYLFLQVVNGWLQARWSPGVAHLIMDGAVPARVPDTVIAQIRESERDGLVELPRRRELAPGTRVRVTQGPLAGFGGLYAGQRPRERILVLLTVLGACRPVELRAGNIEAV